MCGYYVYGISCVGHAMKRIRWDIYLSDKRLFLQDAVMDRKGKERGSMEEREKKEGSLGGRKRGSNMVSSDALAAGAG